MSGYRGPGRYRHYKGGVYKVLGIALREDSIDKGGAVSPVKSGGEQFVIYLPLTPDSLLEHRAEDYWARELSDFNAMVEREHGKVPRFVRECDCEAVIFATIPSPMTEDNPYWERPSHCPNCGKAVE